ncbi:helix-turn-helix domain-containing protein [Candidatus Poriferisodalis sp.]|uniref:helix-turn-helix domain-containing protein n=1 Tax=Candidatus Poriferisodalis sp. TaxID=3101277 RepID=UPI003C6FCF01
MEPVAGISEVDVRSARRRRSAELDALVGERLRAVRRQRRLSLADVEAVSGGEFRTSILGAYERGQRGLRVHRLLRLAEIYGVHPTALLPQELPVSGGRESPRTPSEARTPASSNFPPEAVL